MNQDLLTSMDVFAKHCTKCDQVKPSTDFHRRRSAADGRQHWCKICTLADINARRLSEHGQAYRADYYNKNHEEILARQREYNRTHERTPWLRTDPDRYKATRKRYLLAHAEEIRVKKAKHYQDNREHYRASRKAARERKKLPIVYNMIIAAIQAVKAGEAQQLDLLYARR